MLQQQQQQQQAVLARQLVGGPGAQLPMQRLSQQATQQVISTMNNQQANRPTSLPQVNSAVPPTWLVVALLCTISSVRIHRGISGHCVLLHCCNMLPAGMAVRTLDRCEDYSCSCRRAQCENLVHLAVSYPGFRSLRPILIFRPDTG